MSAIAITDQLDQARRLLTRAERPERSLPALGAAGLAAMTALVLAAAVILGPGVEAPEAAAASSTEAR